MNRPRRNASVAASLLISDISEAEATIDEDGEGPYDAHRENPSANVEIDPWLNPMPSTSTSGMFYVFTYHALM